MPAGRWDLPGGGSGLRSQSRAAPVRGRRSQRTSQCMFVSGGHVLRDARRWCPRKRWGGGRTWGWDGATGGQHDVPVDVAAPPLPLGPGRVMSTRRTGGTVFQQPVYVAAAARVPGWGRGHRGGGSANGEGRSPRCSIPSDAHALAPNDSRTNSREVDGHQGG